MDSIKNGQVGIDSQGAGLSRIAVSGWKITKRKYQGKVGFWLNLSNKILTEERP